MRKTILSALAQTVLYSGIVYANGTEDRGFEPRQGVRFLD
jgi:hypothetical protein